jgi:hypothetical protein
MAKIKVDEIEDLISVEPDYYHAKSQTVLTFLGQPVLYGPAELLEDRDEAEGLTYEFKERIARILGRLLMAEGGLDGWQTTPLED